VFLNRIAIAHNSVAWPLTALPEEQPDAERSMKPTRLGKATEKTWFHWRFRRIQSGHRHGRAAISIAHSCANGRFTEPPLACGTSPARSGSNAPHWPAINSVRRLRGGRPWADH